MRSAFYFCVWRFERALISGSQLHDLAGCWGLCIDFAFFTIKGFNEKQQQPLDSYNLLLLDTHIASKDSFEELLYCELGDGTTLPQIQEPPSTYSLTYGI